MLPVKIAGLGWSLPARVVSSGELERRMDLPAGWIERVTGVAERRYATDETSVGLATAAARMALDRADAAPDAVDLIIAASAGPQQAIPCTAAFVQRALKVPDGRCLCFDVNATCLSFLVAFHTAAQFLAQGVYRRILVVSSEIANHMRNFKERESAVLLGDGAAAAVLERGREGEASAVWGGHFTTHASGADFTTCRGGGTLHHPNDPATTPEMNQFHMDGRAVFKMARRLVGPFVDALFNTLPWDRSAVDAVVPHQASGPGVDLLERCAGFTAGQIVRNLRTRGNCVAASIPLALAEAVDAGRIRRGDRVLLIGSGAGLTLGGVALTY
jgi:3-oxoacyl-[acyl-carrier-protein] synthase-3